MSSGKFSGRKNPWSPGQGKISSVSACMASTLIQGFTVSQHFDVRKWGSFRLKRYNGLFSWRLASAIPLGVEKKSFSKTIKREQFSFGRGGVKINKLFIIQNFIFQEHFIIEFQFNFVLNNFPDKP